MQLKLTSVTLLKDTGTSSVSYMELEFENSENALYLGDYNETLDCIGKEVMVDYVNGMFEKESRLFVNEITVIGKVVTLDKTENVKLYPESYPRNESTISFKDLDIGDPVNKYIVFCTSVKYGASKKADWIELTIIDKDWRVSIAKQFSPEDKVDDFINHYIMVDLKKTAYGLNIEDDIIIMNDYDSIVDPRVQLSRSYIQESIKSDIDLVSAVNDSGLIKSLMTYDLEEDIIAGYETVRMANELYIADSLVNITPNIDIKTIKRFILMSRLYRTRYKAETTLSPGGMNIVLIQRYKLGGDPKLVALIDKESTVNCPERDTMESIKNLSQNIVNADKTYLYEERRKIVR